VSTTPVTGRVSLAEYLTIDAASTEKLEYRAGYIVAQAVGTGNHEQIKNNLVMELGPIVRTTGCRLFSGGVKVVCPNSDRTIPDFGVTCDERDLAALAAPGEAIIERPWLLIEILSPATASDDRGEKLDAYNAIRALTHYVLIDSRRQWMMLHVRTSDGLLALNGPLESFTLPTLGEIGLEMIYRDTSVPRIV
jgi:Uma2 family endonuclease